MNSKAIQKIRLEISRLKLDAILISSNANMAYLSNFRGEGELLITPTKKILFTDFRFTEQATKVAKSFQIYKRNKSHSKQKNIVDLARKLKIKRLGFEATGLSYQAYCSLKKSLSFLKVIPTINIIEQIRSIKNSQEIKLIKKATFIAVKTMSYAKRIIKPGKQEIEIAQKIEQFIQAQGCEEKAFNIIVASGANSSMPHAIPSRRTIKNNQPVLVDLGCRFCGYNSDLTRTWFLGKISAQFRRIHDIVSLAQQMAIAAIKPGVVIAEIDNIAREHIIKEGFGPSFEHALGHSIGREVHEHPSVSSQNHEVLRENMVLTIEPGIYLPGWGGVRVEDMVLVTKKGSKVLTR